MFSFFVATKDKMIALVITLKCFLRETHKHTVLCFGIWWVLKFMDLLLELDFLDCISCHTSTWSNTSPHQHLLCSFNTGLFLVWTPFKVACSAPFVGKFYSKNVERITSESWGQKFSPCYLRFSRQQHNTFPSVNSHIRWPIKLII